MKPLLMLSISLLLLTGCGKQIDTKDMVGISFSELETKYQLQDALAWGTPNMPPASDSETTYYLDGGDLTIRVNADNMVSSATFESRTSSPKERLDSVRKGWSEYVRPRNEYLNRHAE